ncbi:MAG: phosphoglucosamine mutase [Candidatus Aminicenantes bacterium]|nr:phosphoglucosamine mutase [Candidatus Aminicenantes bacterium]
MMGGFFGTDGIRARAGEFPLDEATLIKLGQVIGSLTTTAGSKAGQMARIVIGRDTRESGPAIEKHLAGGLARKAAIFSAGVIPTPGLAYLTRTQRFDFGIMISASHNPFSDNGIKIFDGRGEKISARFESKISARLSAGSKAAPGQAAIAGIAEHSAYIDFLLANGRDLKPGDTRIAIDCANGAAGSVAPALFRRLGMKTLLSHHRANGRNINDGCGSTSPQALQRFVRDNKAGLGMAFDGDADRVIFVASDGEILTGDHTLFLLAAYLRRREPRFNGVVVGTVMANLGLEKALACAGIRFLRTDVGDSRVYRQMKKAGAILGGEPSGHIILRHRQTTGDGLLAALFFMKALDFFGWSAGDVCRRLRVFPQRTVNIPIRRKKNLARWQALARAEKEFVGTYGRQARLLIRYSGTEPLVRVMMEARDAGVIENRLPHFTDLIQNEIGA